MSVTYEILFYMNYVYLYAFLLFEIMMGLVKLWTTKCPMLTLLTETCLFVLLYLVEDIRISLGRRGNLSNKKAPVFCSILLNIPSVTGIFFLLFYQTYVLRMEYLVGAVLLMFQAMELGFGIIFIFVKNLGSE